MLTDKHKINELIIQNMFTIINYSIIQLFTIVKIKMFTFVN